MVKKPPDLVMAFARGRALAAFWHRQLQPESAQELRFLDEMWSPRYNSGANSGAGHPQVEA